jgi:hypothetical protein
MCLDNKDDHDVFYPKKRIPNEFKDFRPKTIIPGVIDAVVDLAIPTRRTTSIENHEKNLNLFKKIFNNDH